MIRRETLKFENLIQSNVFQRRLCTVYISWFLFFEFPKKMLLVELVNSKTPILSDVFQRKLCGAQAHMSHVMHISG